MHIEIHDNIPLSEIQKVFSDFYPYLKIEFYRKPHKKYEASDEKNQIDPDSLIKDIRATHVSGLLEILPLYRVSQVESEIQQRFGLSAQIYRKEKEGWEQTTDMDDFTLKELNEIGRNSSDEFILEDDEEDFEETSEELDELY